MVVNTRNQDYISITFVEESTPLGRANRVPGNSSGYKRLPLGFPLSKNPAIWHTARDRSSSADLGRFLYP